MRTNRELVNLAKEAFQKGKVIAAICHGPQLLIEAGVVKGKKATARAQNSGGIYLNKSVVVDRNLVTSRFPADLPDFCRETLKLLEKENKSNSV